MNINERFNRLQMHVITPGLERVKQLAAAVGNPETDLKFIHIAGTNGKGSTGAMLECALRHCGQKTGFYTSPHLVDIRERFRINGKILSENEVEIEADKLAEIGKNIQYSYFEFATVLALLLFKKHQVDIVVWETGMGGTYDATNIVTPEASVITNIALDHMAFLGDTIEKIAGEKAGIIKPGVPVFTGILPAEALAVIQKRAKTLNSPCTIPQFPTPKLTKLETTGNALVNQCFSYQGNDVKLGLLGTMQRKNFQVVFEVLKYYSAKNGLDFKQAIKSLELVKWPARFQRLEERLYIDGGHNPDGIQALCEAINELLPAEIKIAVVFGAFKDKDAIPSLKGLAQLADIFYFAPLGSDGRPSKSPEELAAIIPGIPYREAPSAPEAVKMALAETKGIVIVAGSLYMAGEILADRAPLAALDLC